MFLALDRLGSFVQSTPSKYWALANILSNAQNLE